MRSMILFFSVGWLLLAGGVSAQERSAFVPSGTPIPCNQRSFSIPFEVRNDGASDPPKEIELLYSSDRGARWFSVKRLPLDAKKFDFTAPSDGEYWFIFRTITLSGVIKAANQSGPQLRVLVDTVLPEPVIASTSPTTAAPPLNPLRSVDKPTPQMAPEATVVPITPPKPLRKQARHETVKKIADIDEPVVPQNKIQQTPPTLFSPSGEAVPVQSPTEKKRPIDPLLVEMSRFYNAPLAKSEPRIPTPEPSISNSEPLAPNPEFRVPGTISGVSLGDVQRQPRVVVRWDIGNESWQSAYVDILRGTSPLGPWLPMATNLPNNGEYWWFVTKEDFKPFHVSVRLRLSSGASTSDATRLPIRIEPAMFNSTAVTALR